MEDKVIQMVPFQGFLYAMTEQGGLFRYDGETWEFVSSLGQLIIDTFEELP